MNRGIVTGSIIVILLLIASGLVYKGCASVPKQNIRPVGYFEIEKYLGDWYEIGRFDFKWEKNLNYVRTNYSMNKDGTIKVINKGYDYVAKKDKKITGKAKFAGRRKDLGELKVSFFGPFYSPYTIIALDAEYKYALVAGQNNKLLWLLSRTPTIPREVEENCINIARAAGYDMRDFVWTVQE